MSVLTVSELPATWPDIPNLPHSAQSSCKLLGGFSYSSSGFKPLFEVPPKVFNGVEVWGLCRPLHNSKSMVLEPVLSPFTGMLWGIILLEDNIRGGFVVIMERFLKLLIQDGTVELRKWTQPLNSHQKTGPGHIFLAPVKGNQVCISGSIRMSVG